MDLLLRLWLLGHHSAVRVLMCADDARSGGCFGVSVGEDVAELWKLQERNSLLLPPTPLYSFPHTPSTDYLLFGVAFLQVIVQRKIFTLKMISATRGAQTNENSCPKLKCRPHTDTING